MEILKKANIELKGRLVGYAIPRNGLPIRIIDKSNLITYQGREYVLERLFGVDNENTSTNPNLVIAWISFGSGGAPASSPQDPIPPSSTDTSLVNELIVSDNPTKGYADGGRKVPLTIEYVQDNKNSNRFLIARCEAIIAEDDLIDKDINEYGIWLSNSNDPTTATEFKLFSRLTDITIRKLPIFSFKYYWVLYA